MNLRFPIGGCAKGIPSQRSVPLTVSVPRKEPDVVFTIRRLEGACDSDTVMERVEEHRERTSRDRSMASVTPKMSPATEHR